KTSLLRAAIRVPFITIFSTNQTPQLANPPASHLTTPQTPTKPRFKTSSPLTQYFTRTSQTGRFGPWLGIHLATFSHLVLTIEVRDFGQEPVQETLHI